MEPINYPTGNFSRSHSPEWEREYSYNRQRLYAIIPDNENFRSSFFNF